MKLKSLRYLIPFWVHNERVVKQIQTSEGFLKGKLLAAHDLSMWTTTLWVSKEALKTFYLSGDHRIVIGKLNEWSSEAVTGYQEVDTNELPSWNQIDNHLCKRGNFAKLTEPSIDHKNRIISSPRFASLVRNFTPTQSSYAVLINGNY